MVEELGMSQRLTAEKVDFLKTFLEEASRYNLPLDCVMFHRNINIITVNVEVAPNKIVSLAVSESDVEQEPVRFATWLAYNIVLRVRAELLKPTTSPQPPSQSPSGTASQEP